MSVDDYVTERASQIVTGAMFGLTTPSMVDAIVSDLAAAGLLATPKHDAAVAAKALRDAAAWVHDLPWEASETRAHRDPLSWMNGASDGVEFAVRHLDERAAAIEAGESGADA